MNTLLPINTFFFFSTICFCMDDANFTYHPSLIIYYSSKWCRYLDTCVTGYRYFDARLACCTTEPPGFIMNKCMYYSSTHFIFSHQHIFPPLWMVDAMFIFILFFLSRLTFVQFGIHSVVSSYAWFILFYCVYTFFHHVHPTL